jgi:hypothetical protein
LGEEASPRQPENLTTGFKPTKAEGIRVIHSCRTERAWTLEPLIRQRKADRQA